MTDPQAAPSGPIPDITRVFRGAANEFEVELVFGPAGCTSPREGHPFRELVVVTEGAIRLERDDAPEAETHRATALVEIPAGVVHRISLLAETNRLVIVHPDRTAPAGS